MSATALSSSAVPLTQWTLIDHVGQGQPEALGQFLGLYRRAMVTHLVHRQRWQWADAEDLVRGFIVDKIITRALMAALDRGRGRFRNVLLTALDNYGRERRRAAGSLKRRPDAGGSFDEHVDAPDSQAVAQDDAADLGPMFAHLLSSPLDFPEGPLKAALGTEMGLLTVAERAKLLSFADLLNDPHPPKGLLILLKNFAKTMISQSQGVLPRELPGVLYFTAIAKGIVCGLGSITKLDGAGMLKGFSWALEQSWVGEPCWGILAEAAGTLR